MFEHAQFTVNEPIIKGDVTRARIPVIRFGDTSGRSEVKVTTQSMSAKADRDFALHSQGK